MACNHDMQWVDTGDEGTSHCVYCRCLAAEKEIERLEAELGAAILLLSTADHRMQFGWCPHRCAMGFYLDGQWAGPDTDIRDAIKALAEKVAKAAGGREAHPAMPSPPPDAAGKKR